MLEWFGHDGVKLAALFALLLAASGIDLATRRIPNWLCLIGLCTGLMLQALLEGALGFGLGCAGAVMGLVVFLPLYVIATVGAGDVKLVAAVGAFVGPGGALLAAIASTMAAGIVGILVIASYGDLRRFFARYGAMLRDFIRTGQVLYIAPAPNEAARLRIAYAPAILLGTLMSQWYLGQLDPLISRLEF